MAKSKLFVFDKDNDQTQNQRFKGYRVVKESTLTKLLESPSGKFFTIHQLYGKEWETSHSSHHFAMVFYNIFS